MTRIEVTRRVTLGDVALAAGVSLATASKALNGRTDVAERTRRKVEDTARALDFTPNPMAQALLAGRTGTVGLLTNDLEGRFVLPILAGAEDALGADSINAFLCDARGDAIREQHHLKALLSRRVDGIIVVASRTDPRRSLGRDLPVPVVYAYGSSEDPNDLSVTPDNVAGAELAIDHLVASGRRRIAHISGDAAYRAATDRWSGARNALSRAGLDLIGQPLFSEWSEHWGRDAAALLLTQHPDIDAIFCASDQLARGALEVARDFGRSVPEDLAIVGYDNWTPLSTNSRPGLTSVDSNLPELGRRAAQLVFDAIDGVQAPVGEEFIPPRLVVRGSSVLRQ